MARGALSHRDFRLLLIGSGVVSFVMPMQFITQVFWVQDTYPQGIPAALDAAAAIAAGLCRAVLV